MGVCYTRSLRFCRGTHSARCDAVDRAPTFSCVALSRLIMRRLQQSEFAVFRHRPEYDNSHVPDDSRRRHDHNDDDALDDKRPDDRAE